jgi:flagellar basal-body rod modification protein FlgD
MALTTQQIAQQSQVKIVDSANTGFNGLTSNDFLKLLITQLQNQDPSNPMNSDQLLQQISEMRALQSNLELSNSLKSLTLSQQLTSATSFLGKQVSGTDANNNSVSGTVDHVVVNNGTTMLAIGNSQVALNNVTNISNN